MPTKESDFARKAEGKQRSMIGELWDFMRTHKKWWLLPIIIALLVLGLLLVLGGGAAAPFIYTLF